jgi:hypothetical protein
VEADRRRAAAVLHAGLMKLRTLSVKQEVVIPAQAEIQ